MQPENSMPEKELSAAFCAVAGAMLQESRSQDVLTVSQYILAHRADDEPALFFAARASRALGNIEDALEYMACLLEAGKTPSSCTFDTGEEIRSLLLTAVGDHGRYIETGKLQEALSLTEKMIRVSPRAKPFIESAQSLCRALGNVEKESGYRLRLQELLKAEHDQMQEQANQHHEAGQYEEELAIRVALFEHPYDLQIHTAWRLQNIHHALGCMFLKPLDGERQQLAKRLLAAVPSPYDMADPEKSDMLGRFDKFYRLSLKAIDIDAIYGPPVRTDEKPAMLFADGSGSSLSLEQIRQKIEDRDVKAGFFAAGTKPYFERCAKYYVESILKNSDMSCLVFVCATGAWDTAENIAKLLGISDERLIVCTDDFEDDYDKYRVYTTHDIKANDPCPHGGSHYYATVGLLYLNLFIDEFGLPMFLSGIDTVLQRGVSDILEKFKNADVVVNESFGAHISSKLINSLQLVYPTDNAMLFALFMKDQLGKMVRQIQQPFAVDQLFLYLAIHHMLANGVNPAIAYFDEFDINNCMFNRDNVETYRTHLEKFRFVNIFHGGQGDKALSGENIC